MKPLASHKKCCKSRLDRLRHEYDRACKALEFEEAKPPEKQRTRRLAEIERYVRHTRLALGTAEKEAAAWAKTSQN